MSGRTRRPKLVPKVVFGLTLGASVVPVISCTPQPMPVADMSYTAIAVQPAPPVPSSQDGTTATVAIDAAPAPTIALDAGPVDAAKADAGKTDAGKADAGKTDAGKLDAAGARVSAPKGPPVLVVAQIGYENPVALKAFDGPGTKTP